MLRLDDPLLVPRTKELPQACFERAVSAIDDERARAYLARRAIPVEVALQADVRFLPELAGRPAVVTALRGWDGAFRALHARYLHSTRAQNKMLTVGAPGGIVSVLAGLRADALIVVEGLFDALSLATCGVGCIATIGREIDWLPEQFAARSVWIAFDAGRPGESEAQHLHRRLVASEVGRLPPPHGCQDWNTALMKRGAVGVARWLRERLARSGTTPA